MTEIRREAAEFGREAELGGVRERAEYAIALIRIAVEERLRYGHGMRKQAVPSKATYIQQAIDPIGEVSWLHNHGS